MSSAPDVFKAAGLVNQGDSWGFNSISSTELCNLKSCLKYNPRNTLKRHVAWDCVEEVIYCI